MRIEKVENVIIKDNILMMIVLRGFLTKISSNSNRHFVPLA